MSKKKNADSRGFVYSTDPNFRFEEEQAQQNTLPPEQQQLRVRLETKHRGGKTATVITGFIGRPDDLESLAKQLKNYCGTGGSSKEGEVIIQGDQREKVLQWLMKNGYKAKKM